jgi:hypothetical protein
MEITLSVMPSTLSLYIRNTTPIKKKFRKFREQFEFWKAPPPKVQSSVGQAALRMRDRQIHSGYQPGYIYIYISTYLLVLTIFKESSILVYNCGVLNFFWKSKNRPKNCWVFHENHQLFEISERNCNIMDGSLILNLFQNSKNRLTLVQRSLK